MKLGLTKRLEKALNRAEIPYTLYNRTVANLNPTTVNVAEALELYIQDGCDAIIGFGGGSSMDCAKSGRSKGGKTEPVACQNERNPQRCTKDFRF